jgi:hypothetical protein
MKTHSRGEDRMAGVGFKSGPLLPMIWRRGLLRQALTNRQFSNRPGESASDHLTPVATQRLAAHIKFLAGNDQQPGN